MHRNENNYKLEFYAKKVSKKDHFHVMLELKLPHNVEIYTYFTSKYKLCAECYMEVCKLRQCKSKKKPKVKLL